MRIEDIVTSLEISKRLFDLGIKQNGFFAWVNIKNTKGYGILYEEDVRRFGESISENYSAFTASEILHILPHLVDGYNFNIEKIITDEYSVFYEKYIQYDGVNRMRTFTSNKLSDSLGEMLIYLIENKLIEFKS